MPKSESIIFAIDLHQEMNQPVSTGISKMHVVSNAISRFIQLKDVVKCSKDSSLYALAFLNDQNAEFLMDFTDGEDVAAMTSNLEPNPQQPPPLTPTTFDLNSLVTMVHQHAYGGGEIEEKSVRLIFIFGRTMAHLVEINPENKLLLQKMFKAGLTVDTLYLHEKSDQPAVGTLLGPQGIYDAILSNFDNPGNYSFEATKAIARINDAWCQFLGKPGQRPKEFKPDLTQTRPIKSLQKTPTPKPPSQPSSPPSQPLPLPPTKPSREPSREPSRSSSREPSPEKTPNK